MTVVEKQWFTLEDGRQVYRAVPQPAQARSTSFPCPRIISDNIEPTWGADGKQHTSMSSYRASLLPSGNPKGERFIEYGNEAIPTYEPPTFSKADRIEAIKHAIHDVETGNVPVSVEGDGW